MTAIERSDEIDVALDRLREELRELESVVVAFSGGADSAFLAYVANQTLGPPSLPLQFPSVRNSTKFPAK